MLRVMVLGLMGLLLAGAAVVGYVALQPGAAAQVQAAAPTVSVIAAAHEVRAGNLLQPADVTTVEMDPGKLPGGALTDTPETRAKLIGAMVRRLLAERGPILLDDVLRPGDRGFLAAVLPPGARAVSVGVDAVSGAAGLIWPGDRVDVILTQTLDAPDQAAGRRVAGETVLGDVRVIAVDQLLVQGGQASNILDGHAPSSRTITLEVSSRDAARIAVATRLGKLQVVLLSARPELLRPETWHPEALRPEAPRDDTVSEARHAASAPEPGLASSGLASPRLASPRLASPGLASSGPVWGGDVSQALGRGAERNVEVRLFRGAHAVQSYHF